MNLTMCVGFILTLMHTLTEFCTYLSISWLVVCKCNDFNVVIGLCTLRGKSFFTVNV